MERLSEIEQEEIKTASLNRIYKIERDRLKSRFFLYTAYPKINYYSLSLNAAKRFVILDIFARYHRMIGENILLSCGYNNLNSSLFNVSSKLSKSTYDLVKNGYLDYQKVLTNLDVGFDKQKEIFLNSDEYIMFVENFFKHLFQKDLIKRHVGYLAYDQDRVYQSYETTFDNGEFYNQDGKRLNSLKRNLCYLDLTNIENDLVEEIKHLPLDRVSISGILKVLGYYEGVSLTFKTLNEGTLTLDLLKPEYLFGLSFLILNPNLMDVTPYVSESEVAGISDYEGLIYAGNALINPLNGEEIPIFISTKFEEAIHLGLPSLNNTDENLANLYDLPFKPIFDYVNGEKVLVNSSFLNGYNEEEAHLKIREELLKAGLGKAYNKFITDEICLSSPYKFGLPIPLTNDFKMAMLPVTYDLKHELRLESYEVNDKGLIKDFFLDNFSEAFLINAIRLKNESGILDFNSNLAFEEIGFFKDVNFAIYSKDMYQDSLAYECLVSTLFKKYYVEGFNYHYDKILIEPLVLDEQGRRFKREYNNLVSLENLIKTYGNSPLRLMASLDSQNIFTLDRFQEYVKLTNEIFKVFNYPIVDNCYELDFEFERLTHQAKFLMDDYNLTGYVNALISFEKKVHEVKKLSHAQAKTYLIYLAIIFPSVAENIRKNVLKLKEPIYYYSFFE